MKGLEKQRRCGFLPEAEKAPERPVWSRGPIVLTECPVSFIRPESLTTIEEHHVWRMGERGALREYPAKTVEGFAVLESELLREKNHGNR